MPTSLRRVSPIGAILALGVVLVLSPSFAANASPSPDVDDKSRTAQEDKSKPKVNTEDDGFSKLKHGPSDPDAFTKIESGPVESGLSSQPSGGTGTVMPMAGLQLSPAGCKGKTDTAHWATGNYASVHARTTCNVAVPSLGVSTNLQKQGWAYWENIKWGESSRAGASHSQDAHPHWYCWDWDSQNYRGVSSHWSSEASGYYSGTTVGYENRFWC